MALRSNSPWRFLVTDLSHQILGDLPIRNVKITEDLNKPVAMSGQIALNEVKAVRSLLDPVRTKVWALRNGTPYFGGLLWTIKPTLPTNDLQLSMSDDFSYFHARILKVTKTYASPGTDQGTIVKEILDYAQGLSGGDIGMIVPTETTGVLRERTWWHYERPIIGKLIEQMANVIDGFDFHVEVGGSVGAGLTSTFRMDYPVRGANNGLRWRIHDNKPGNTIVALSGGESGDQMTNDVSAIGMGEGDHMLWTEADDAVSIGLGYPLLQDVITLKDVSIFDTLQGHADEFLRTHLRPPRTFNATLRRGHPDTDLDAFQVGDLVTLDVDWGYYHVDDFTVPWRVTGRDITVNDNTGDTTVSVSLLEDLGDL